MRTAAARTLALLALALLAACGDIVTGAERLGPIYVLQSVAGAPAPMRPLPGSSFEIIADTLFVALDGAGVQRRTIRTIPDSVLISDEIGFAWWMNGTQLGVLAECPQTRGLMPCPKEPSFQGTATSTSWVVEHSDRYGVPAVFERVR